MGPEARKQAVVEDNMNLKASVARLIGASYDAAEKSEFLSFTASNLQLEKVAEAGVEVLERSPSAPGACTYLTAMWTAILRDVLSLPAYCVTGDLCVRGQLAFGSNDPNAVPHLNSSSDAWDGHCWLVLGQYVGDLSVFRTAYALPEGSNLRRAVLEEFGLGRGFLLMKHSDALAIGFDYRPKYVATEAEVTALIRGARTLGKL